MTRTSPVGKTGDVATTPTKRVTDNDNPEVVAGGEQLPLWPDIVVVGGRRVFVALDDGCES